MRKAIVALASVTALFALGCGGSAGQSVSSNPTPTITSISPNSIMAGGAAFTLTINGANFVAASTVNFNGIAPSATFVSATQLTAAIPAAAIASVGSATVTATNPAPGGGTSNAVNFTITGSPNGPTISSLDPSCAAIGGSGFNLLVFGSNFVASSVVRWNGNDRPTTVIDAGTVEAQIPAGDIATAGTVAITVFSSPPGSGSSNASTFTIAATGLSPQSIAVDPTGKFAYVASQGCPDAFEGSVSPYMINPTTGALASLGPPLDSNDEGARSVTVDPSGKFVYVANWGEGDTAGSIAMYTINVTTGVLTSTGTIFAACPGSGCSLLAPWSVVVDPSGKFVYVANEGGAAPTSVAMFTINATTGALTSMGAVTAGGRAVSVAVDPAGKFAYVTNISNGFPGENDIVSMFTIDATTGSLTSIGTIAAGTHPVSVVVDPTGKFAYVTNSGSNDVSMYTINPTTGALTSIGSIAAGMGPASVAIDPTGKFAYVANSGSNDVSMYSLDATTGALTSAGTIAAGPSPTSVAIHPSGNFAYVTNSGSNNVSMYSIDATTGALTLIGTVGT